MLNSYSYVLNSYVYTQLKYNFNCLFKDLAMHIVMAYLAVNSVFHYAVVD